VGEIVKKLSRSKENLSALRRVQKYLKLAPASLALLYHEKVGAEAYSIEAMATHLKDVPLKLLEPDSLDRAISSKGGICLQELAPNFSLKKAPRIFVAGEMLNWDAPTGGFLIQGSVSQGFKAGTEALNEC
jgi:predicted flavoprotein YhiN